MKQGWEYKKLGEVCTSIFAGGDVPKDRLSKEPTSSFTIPIYTNGVVDEGLYGFTDKARVEEPAVTISARGTLGAVFKRYKPFYPAIRLITLVPSEAASIDFLYYVLGCLQIEKEGVAIPQLTVPSIKKHNIPLPPLAEQQTIVAELDKINEIIDLKKAQLKDLDLLAQSIFYEMFGDPIENPKGWEVKKLGEVSKTTSGGTPSKTHQEYYENGTIPWLRSGEVSQGFIYNTELFISEEGLKNSSAKMIPVDSVAIAMYGATVGQVGIIKSEMCTNQAICSILPNNVFLPIYLYHFLMSKKNEYLSLASGGAQPNISQGIIKDTKIGIPPLSLQQSFAEKIQAIESQKSAIKQSLAEVETLLASRMDYYFN